MHGLTKADALRRGDELIARVGPDRGGRPQGRRLLGRHAPPPRPGAGARPRAADPVPRRADHRPRRAEPHGALGRGPAARLRRTASPSSSPPSTWRRPTRSPTGSGSSTPARSSPRARRIRSRPRSAGRPSRRRPPTSPTATGCARFSTGSDPRSRAGPGGVAVRLDEGTGELAAVVRALDAEGIEVANLEIHAPTPRRRLPREDRPPARGRRRRGGRRRASTRWRRERRRRNGPRPGGGARRALEHAHPGRLSRPALGHPDAAPADHVRAQPRLPAVPARRQLERARARRPTSPASRPTPI